MRISFVFRCISVFLATFAIGIAVHAAPLKIAKDGGTISVTENGNPVLVYLGEKVPFKPYVQQYFSPGGFNVLRDQVPDHVHHHGLMYALAVDGVCFWAETPESGHEVTTSLDVLPSSDKGTSDRPGFVSQIEWRDPKGKVLLNEKRTVTVRRLSDASGPASFLTWESQLSVPAGKKSVELTGSHYYGLGMRFPEAMDAIGAFTNASGTPGEIVRGEERNVPAGWCAYSAAPGGKPITVASFGDERNVRGPATWFTMAKAFAYMSATLNLYKEPMKLDADKPLVLRYAVVVWDGKVESEQIEKSYRAWLSELR